jgi:hypothetical protein
MSAVTQTIRKKKKGRRAGGSFLRGGGGGGGGGPYKVHHQFLARNIVPVLELGLGMFTLC